MSAPHLILKRATASRPSGEWNDDDYDVLCEGAVVGRIMKSAAAPVGQPWLWTLAYGRHEDHTPTHGYEPTREAAMAIASTPCSPLPATTSALGYNEDRRQLQLMDGWQASEAWRANLRAEYVLSEAGGRGRRRSGVGREEDSDQRCQDFYFQNFFPKNLAKKLGRVLQPEISGMVCVRVRFCSTPPPFVQMKNTPGGSCPGAFPGAAFGARKNHEFQLAPDSVPLPH